MPTAKLHRMLMPQHRCPYGQKSLWLLRHKGYTVEDHPLRTRAEVDAFQQAHGVETTPQTWIDGRRIGGWDDLRRHFGWRVAAKDAPSYRPVIAIFAAALLMALAVSWLLPGPAAGPWGALLLQRFAAIAMCLLALQKLQDVESFSSMFLNYDLLAQRWVPYAYLYPFAEMLAGLLMLAHVLPWLSVPLALVIGGAGAWSVFKAVYLEKRTLKCACVGGNSNVPLGAVSLVENLMMVAMGLWMALGG